MNDGTKCSVVRDLLPGYVENLTSEATNAFVAEHLAECAECRAAHRAMTGRLNGDEIRTQALLKNMKRRRTVRLVRMWGIALAALLALAVCLLPLPRHIRKTCQAVEWRCGDETHAVPRTVTISGYYMDYFFRQDCFDGSIVVEGYPVTEQALLGTSRFSGGTAFLAYYAQTEESGAEPGALQYFGQIMMTPNGESFAVLVYENHGWSSENGLVITGPAAGLGEAVELTRSLARKYAPGLAAVGV